MNAQQAGKPANSAGRVVGWINEKNYHAEPKPAETSGHAPFSQEAEQAVIGAAIITASVFQQLRASVHLEATDFYFLRHGYIWRVMERISERGEAIDIVTVQNELRTVGQFDEVGGMAYLLHLTNNTPNAYHAETYGALVRRASFRRRLMTAADQIKDIARDEAVSTDEGIRQVDQVYRSAITMRINTPRTDMQALAEGALASIEAVYQGEYVPVIPIGLTVGKGDKAESLTLRKGEVTILAGAAGFGKSSAIIGTIVSNVAPHNVSVVIFSNEETEAEITMRLVCRQAGVNLQRAMTGKITPKEYSKLVTAAGVVGSWKYLNIHYMPDMTPGGVDRALDAINADIPIDLVVVDGLYRVSADPLLGKNGAAIPETRTQIVQMREVMIRFTKMAAERRAAFLCAHHFNRDETCRGKERPDKMKLAEASATEKMAQSIWALWRPPLEEGVFDETQNGGEPTRLVSLKGRFTQDIEVKMVFEMDGNYYRTDDRPRINVNLRESNKGEHPF